MTNKSSYNDQVRVRACGLLLNENGLLLIKHSGLGPGGYLWSPPGGGVTFGTSIKDTLIREFKEETHLEVQVGEFLFANEYYDGRFHATELFFRVIKQRGVERIGSDPERPPDQQIILDLKYFTEPDLNTIDIKYLHNLFRFSKKPVEIVKMRGFFNHWVI